MKDLHKQVGDIWSGRYENGQSAGRMRWSGSETVIRHISNIICGAPLASINDAKISLLQKISKRLPHARGISIGCGTGLNEIALLEAGIVSRFDCYELSEKAVENGMLEAQKRNLEGRIVFHRQDVFALPLAPGSFDLVYWDNAMHHMFDADAAMRWSKEMLAPNGCFFMHDFVGPTRFQWSEEQMRLVKQVLEGLDDAYFLIPNSEYMWKKEPSRMSVEEMMEADPSEAADSDNILPAFAKHFPEGAVIPLGGLLYALGLDGIIVNIPEKSLLLQKLLKLDEMFARQGHNYYAVSYYCA